MVWLKSQILCSANNWNKLKTGTCRVLLGNKDMESFTSCAKLTVTDALARLPDAQAPRFATIFEHGSLLVEIYAPRGVDPQKPHARDELYFVVSGSGEYVCDGVRQPFKPTDLLFAAAGAEHRFENFTGDLVVWVVFYGPEGGEADRGE
jgi:mannose-6-phosphate isomerase-like protein (cupin superfamily)